MISLLIVPNIYSIYYKFPAMSPQNKQFCFCTLALSQKYSKLAALLAQDIENFLSSTTLIILTDQPA